MKGTGHVAYMEEKGNTYRVLMESEEERDYWEDLGVGGRIILRCTLEKYDMVVWTGFI
jgi:hypothetical protein